MKRAFLILASAGVLAAQQPARLVGAGVYYHTSASPKLSGWASYAQAVAPRTYAYAAIEALPVKTETGWLLSARYMGGTMVRVFSVARLDVYGSGGLGAESVAGGTALAGAAGAVAVTRITGPWRIVVPIQWSNSTQSLYRVTVGVGVAWGE